MTVDRARVAAAIAEVANAVILPRFGRLERHEIRQKSGPDDLVTEVDEAAEVALREALEPLVPGARFIGEESATRDPSLLDGLRRPGAAWVVDPLDGTRNFIRGVREFGTIVALVVDGETVGGWIHAVPENSGVACLKGEGPAAIDAAVAAPGERLRALRSLGWLDQNEAERLRRRLKRDFAAEPSHCSAYAYLRLLRGEVDLKISSRIHAWDHLAGALLLAELGGRTAYLDGEPYAPGPSVDRALLATAPGRDWHAIAERLLDH